MTVALPAGGPAGGRGVANASVVHGRAWRPSHVVPARGRLQRRDAGGESGGRGVVHTGKRLAIADRRAELASTDRLAECLRERRGEPVA
jgi:hypothetical protein